MDIPNPIRQPLTPEHDKREWPSTTDNHPDITAAYRYVESRRNTADVIEGRCPMWYGWALREAFLAGISYAQQSEPNNYFGEQVLAAMAHPYPTGLDVLVQFKRKRTAATILKAGEYGYVVRTHVSLEEHFVTADQIVGLARSKP